MSIQSRFPDLRTKLSLILSYLPQRRSGDVFIVAHPRSGSTWLRTMLVNVMQPDANSNPDVFNQLIPGVSIRNIHDVWDLPSPRILTSHTSHLPGLPQVVYVVRDGRDSLVSYYHYMADRKPKLHQPHASVCAIDFPTFFERYYQGAYRHIWHSHVESWLGLGKQALGKHLLVVRFEERVNTNAIVSQIAQFAGIPAGSEQVAAAVHQADLENVRKLEKQRWQTKGLGAPNEKTSFYRRGQCKNWEAYFTPELTDRFMTRSANAMQLAGYQQ